MREVRNCEGRIIFLDIDGCLTTVEDGSSFLCLNENTYRISEKKLELFGKLLDETDAKVIISSNWRKFDDDGYWIYGSLKFHNNLPKLIEWLGGRYLGELPYYRGMSKSKTLESWGELFDINFNKLNFIVIDDDYDEGFADNPKFLNRYVHCDSRRGLTEDDCAKAKLLFAARDEEI